jgi:hypothetical protein
MKKINRRTKDSETWAQQMPVGDTPQDGTRDDIVRGKGSWGLNSQRPGLPLQGRGKAVAWIQPQPTTGSRSGVTQTLDKGWSQPSQVPSLLATGSPGNPLTRGEAVKGPPNPLSGGPAPGLQQDKQTPAAGLGYSLGADTYSLAKQMQGKMKPSRGSQ